MKVNKKILALAVLLGLVTAFVLSYYMNTVTKKTIDPQSQVVVAINTIPAHIRITEDMVTEKFISADYIHPEALTSVDRVVGSVSKSEIIKDEQILSSRISLDGAGDNLSYRIPENQRAITIPITEITGVAGNIVVGDKIDILVTYEDVKINPDTTTFTQLQNIEVIGLGSGKLSAEESNASLPSSITLLVNPAQAEELAYATLKGSLHFTLRNSMDLTKQSLTNFNSTNFNTYKAR